MAGAKPLREDRLTSSEAAGGRWAGPPPEDRERGRQGRETFLVPKTVRLRQALGSRSGKQGVQHPPEKSHEGYTPFPPTRRGARGQVDAVAGTLEHWPLQVTGHLVLKPAFRQSCSLDTCGHGSVHECAKGFAIFQIRRGHWATAPLSEVPASPAPSAQARLSPGG